MIIGKGLSPVNDLWLVPSGCHRWRILPRQEVFHVVVHLLVLQRENGTMEPVKTVMC